MSSTTNEELCGVCQSNREAHEMLNHEFNVQGQLIPKKPPKPKGQPGNIIEVMIAVNRLTTLLHQKGLLTDADIMFLATGVQDGGPAST